MCTKQRITIMAFSPVQHKIYNSTTLSPNVSWLEPNNNSVPSCMSNVPNCTLEWQHYICYPVHLLMRNTKFFVADYLITVTYMLVSIKIATITLSGIWFYKKRDIIDKLFLENHKNSLLVIFNDFFFKHSYTKKKKVCQCS